MKNAISKSEFIINILQYLQDLENTEKEIIITDQDKPVFKIIPSEITVN